MLFHLPVWIGVLLTGCSTLMLLALQQYGVSMSPFSCQKNMCAWKWPENELISIHCISLVEAHFQLAGMLIQKVIPLVIRLQDLVGYTCSVRSEEVAKRVWGPVGFGWQVRKLEVLIAFLVFTMAGCFFGELRYASPPAGEILKGLVVPKLEGPGATGLAISLLGAMVMP